MGKPPSSRHLVQDALRWLDPPANAGAPAAASAAAGKASLVLAPP